MNSICFYRNDYSCIVNMRNFHSDPICYNEHEKKRNEKHNIEKLVPNARRCHYIPLVYTVQSNAQNQIGPHKCQPVVLSLLHFFSLYFVGELQINMILNCMPKCFFATAIAANAVILKRMLFFNRIWAF